MEESHRRLLRSNRMEMAKDLDPDPAVVYLYSKFIINEADKDGIEALDTRQKKCEKLLDILPRRGPEGFGLFVKFLEDNQPDLAKLLKTGSEDTIRPSDKIDSSARPVSGRRPVAELGGLSPTQDLKPPSTEQPDAVVSKQTTSPPEPAKPDGTSDYEVPPSQEDGKRGFASTENDERDQGDGKSRSTFHGASVRDGVPRGCIYPMDRRPRGQAIIINNRDFLPASGMQKYPRNGTDVDAEALRKLFRDLLFEAKVYNNQSSKEMNQIFDYYANMNHSNYDCFICAILTHGEEGLIYSTDGKILLKEVTSKFRSRRLFGIPKLFFFQACQGFEYMEAAEETDGPAQEVDEVDAPGNNRITLPVEADFLYAYSTVPGYYSWRNSVRGSWFVQAIVSVFRQNAKTMDVLRMMTRVNAEVARQKSNTNESFSDNKKQIPSIISQLRKELYFFPENVLAESINAEHADKPDVTTSHSGKKRDCVLC